MVWLVALAALVGALLPAGLASGADSSGDPSVVLLTLGSVDQVTWMGTTQAITTGTKCAPVTFASSRHILRATGIGGNLGLVKDGLGVRGSNDGFGDSCGQVEAADGEAISLALDTDLEGDLMSAVDIDLELKFNAVVLVTFKLEGNTVFSESFSGTGGSDDGPDSGDGDNYRYFSRPMNSGVPLLFDEVVFAPSAGAISVEGGADGTENGVLDPNSNSSQFEVVSVFDGQISCGDTVTIAEEGIEQVIGTVTMQALKQGTWDGDCTLQKNYNSDVTASSLLFSPVLETSQARYTLDLTIEEQAITTGSDGQVTSLIMEYNDGFGSANRPLRPCLGQPVFTSAFFEQNDTGLLPSGEFACYYGVALTPTGNGVGTEAWSIFFEDDPDFNFR